MDCKSDKFEYISRLKQLAHETRDRVQPRLAFENRLKTIWQQGLPLAEEREAWRAYIEFEAVAQQMPRRAKLLYERALITMDRDRQFWLEYIRFIEKNLKDP